MLKKCTDGLHCQFALELAPHSAFVIFEPLCYLGKSTSPANDFVLEVRDQIGFGLKVSSVYDQSVYCNCVKGKRLIG